jgi:CheY-like chemotaxis protein
VRADPSAQAANSTHGLESKGLLRSSGVSVQGSARLADRARVMSDDCAARPYPGSTADERPSARGAADPRATLEVAVAGARAACAERGLRFWLELRSVLPARARFDAPRLRQLAALLLEHSIANTATGMVGLRAGWRAPARGELEVIDSSSGPTLSGFELEPTHGAELALARQVARALGGDLGYERAPNERGVYRAWFEMEPVPEAGFRTRLRTRAAGARGRALVVEARRDTRSLLRRVLDEAGLDVATAESGRGAVDATLHGHFDLILLGLDLTALDGFGAIAELRAAGCRAPVIALAAPGQADLRERAAACGFDAFLLEPIDRRTLLGLVARHVRAGATPEPTVRVVRAQFSV